MIGGIESEKKGTSKVSIFSLREIPFRVIAL